jgi:hypothetical protein
LPNPRSTTKVFKTDGMGWLPDVQDTRCEVNPSPFLSVEKEGSGYIAVMAFPLQNECEISLDKQI